MTPGFEHQSTPSHDGGERGTGSNSVAMLSRGAAQFTPGGVFQGRAALTIARMPVFRASGRWGHASTTAAKSGSVLRVSVGK